MASTVSNVLDDYFEWRLDFNIGIELEVAYDQKKRNSIQLTHFDETNDPSIRTEVNGAIAKEFVLKEKYMKYFQYKKDIDNEIKSLLSICYPNNGSCGTHVHVSHPTITKSKYPNFLEHFTNYWTKNSQEKMRQKYPQVRKSNKFAEDNVGYPDDGSTRYKQMNILPSFKKTEDLVHVEFRGYDGLPNPDDKEYSAVRQYVAKDVSGFGAVVEMKMLTYYIEDLCDEFAKAFNEFDHNPLVITQEAIYKSILKTISTSDISNAQDIVMRTIANYYQSQGKKVALLLLRKNKKETLFLSILKLFEKKEYFDNLRQLLFYIQNDSGGDYNVWRQSKLVQISKNTKGNIIGLYETPLYRIWRINSENGKKLMSNNFFEYNYLLKYKLWVDIFDIFAFSKDKNLNEEFRTSLINASPHLPVRVKYGGSQDAFNKKISTIITPGYKNLSDLEWFFRILGDVSFMGKKWCYYLAEAIADIDIVNRILQKDEYSKDIQKIVKGLGLIFEKSWNRVIKDYYSLEITLEDIEKVDLQLRF